MLSILSILIPLLIGLFISVAILVREGRWSEWLLAIFLAPGIGIAISSVLYFFWAIVFQPLYHLPAYLVLEAGLLVIVAGVVWAKFRKTILWPSIAFWKGWLAPRHWNLRTWIGVGGAFLLLVSLANFIEDWILAFFAAPDGNWDAWSIWNLHARFINSGELWRNGFGSGVTWWSHPDYPLLLPGFIARVWGLIASQSQYVPALVELCFILCIFGTIVASIGLLRGWKLAVFAGLFTIPILHDSLGTQQYADMPLAFFFLGTNLCLWLANARKNRAQLLFLAGGMTGAAIWTKNEGWALLLAIAIGEGLILLTEKPKLRDLFKRWLWFGAGIVPLFAAVLVFKVFVAAPNDIVGSFGSQNILAKISDLSRYTLIWQSIQDQFFTIGLLKVGLLPALIGFVFIAGWNQVTRDTAWIGLRLAIIALAYFAIYVLTPHSLEWHLSTSLARLFDQIIPTLIWMVFLFVSNLENGKEVPQ
jgi:hypothetical protein